MLQVKDVIKVMETWAPLSLAESWDNPGLMVGHRDQVVKGILTTLDVTEEAIAYAIDHDCNLIISHHPFIFKGLKQVETNRGQGAMLASLIKHDIAVYSAHTNLDIAPGGLNDMLCQALGLEACSGFIARGDHKNYKLVTYVPTDYADAVRDALAAAGAGQIGNYSHCSFSAHGEGRFQLEEGAQPFIGQEGLLEVVREVRVETIVPAHRMKAVLEALEKAHPYEEVAYDVFALVEPRQVYTLGRTGNLPKEMNFQDFSKYLAQRLPQASLRFGGSKVDCIKRLALCSGAGAEFLEEAKRAGADAYITGDVKYHDAQKAKELGLLLVDAGHFGTEAMVAEGIKAKLEEELGQSLPIIANEIQKDFFF